MGKRVLTSLFVGTLMLIVVKNNHFSNNNNNENNFKIENGDRVRKCEKKKFHEEPKKI